MGESKENRERTRMVFRGRCAVAKGKTVMRHQYLRLDDDGTFKPMLYSAPLGSGKRSFDVIGGIYEGELDVETGTAYGRWSYKGLDQAISEETRAEWRAKEEADLAVLARKKREKKDRQDDPLQKILEPVRKAYRETNTVGRRAILAKVLEYITR